MLVKTLRWHLRHRGTTLMSDREVNMDISNQIKTRREAMGLSQEQLAERVYVSRQTVSNWERDKTYPDIQSLLMLSVLFNTSIDTLVKGDVDVMEETVKRDSKRMTIFAVLMLAMLALAFAIAFSPAFTWMKETWGTAPAVLITLLPAAVAIAFAEYIEYLKRKHDLVTYKEILAFENGEEIVRDPNVMQRRGWAGRHRWLCGTLMALAAALIGAVLGYVFWSFLH